MKLFKKLAPVAAAAVAATMFTVPTAHAEVAASIGISNMYLWRGQNISPNGGAVSGDLVWTGASGLYGGMWTSSEDAGQEWDLFFGYAGKAGPVDFDVSWVNYSYPQNTDTNGNKTRLSKSDFNEILVAVGSGPVKATLYYNVDSDRDDYWYFTLAYSWSKYSVTYGTWDFENGTITTANATAAKPAADQYSHLTLSYAATDDLSFSVNKAFSDLETNDGADVEESFLVAVAYSWSFDLKK